jgi:hypothetical protein
MGVSISAANTSNSPGLTTTDEPQAPREGRVSGGRVIVTGGSMAGPWPIALRRLQFAVRLH